MMYHPNNLLYEEKAFRSDAAHPAHKDVVTDHGFDDADGACEDEFPPTPAALLVTRPAPRDWRLHPEVPDVDWFDKVPERLHAALNILFQWNPDRHERMNRADEHAIRDFKEWVEEQDGAVGFRTPRPHERLKDCGLAGFFHGSRRLGLMATKGSIADMTVNLFKSTSWFQAWGEGRDPSDETITLCDLAQEPPGPATSLRHVLPLAPDLVLGLYAGLRDEKLCAYPLSAKDVSPLPFPKALMSFIGKLGPSAPCWYTPDPTMPELIEIPPNTNATPTCQELCLEGTGSLAVGALPPDSDGFPRGIPGAILVTGSDYERGGLWWQAWNGARIETFGSLHNQRAQRIAAFALAICGSVPADPPELDNGREGFRKSARDYKDPAWRQQMSNLEEALKAPTHCHDLLDRKHPADITMLMTALDILTRQGGPPTGVVVANAKKKPSCEQYYIDKSTAVFLTDVKERAHLLVLTQYGGIMGLARLTQGAMADDRGDINVTLNGLPGSRELDDNAARCQAWGHGLPDCMGKGPLHTAWHVWAGDRGLRLGTLMNSTRNAGGRTGVKDPVSVTPLTALTAALVAAILDGVLFHRSDPVITVLAQYAPAVDPAQPFPTERVTEILVKSWADNLHHIPTPLASALAQGCCVAILNTGNGGRTGITVNIPPASQAVGAAPLPPPLRPSPLPSPSLALLVCADNLHDVPFLSIPSWAAKPSARAKFAQLRETLVAQNQGSTLAVHIALGPQDNVPVAT